MDVPVWLYSLGFLPGLLFMRFFSLPSHPRFFSLRPFYLGRVLLISTEPCNLQDTALTYTGKCVDAYTDMKCTYKSTSSMYLFQMEDGREFWLDAIFFTQGNFDFSHFRDTVPGTTITVRYIDANYSLGPFAKKAVEIRNDTEVFLSMDAVEKTFHRTRVAMWVTYTVVLTAHILVMVIDYLIARRQRKLTAHRQQTKAKRREWLDTHPEEKGAPPSARRKRGRK